MPPYCETSRGLSPTGWSKPTSRTQTGAPLSPPPHKTSPPFSYLLPPFPISLPDVPIFPAPSAGSVPLTANILRRMKTLVPGTRKNILQSVVSHTLRRTSPYVPPYLQQPTSVASSPSRSVTFMKLGATDWGPLVGQTCHTGGTRGGVYSPPPGLLCCNEAVSEQISPVGLSVRTMSLRIPPQVTSIAIGWL